MRRRGSSLKWVMLLAGLVACLCPALRGGASGDPELWEKSLVRVVVAPKDAPAVAGAGFMIGTGLPTEYVIANWRLIQDRTEAVYISSPGEKRVRAEVLRSWPEQDMCLIRTVQPIHDRTPLEIGNSAGVKNGSTIYVPGFTQALLTENGTDTQPDMWVAEGVISRSDKSRNPVFQISPPVGALNAGAPLLDSNGGVIGVCSYTVLSARGINGAFSFSGIPDALDAMGIPWTRSIPLPRPEATEVAEAASAASQAGHPVLSFLATLGGFLLAGGVITMAVMRLSRSAMHRAEAHFRQKHLQSRMSAVLRCVSGPLDGTSLPVTGQGLWLGSQSGCEVMFPEGTEGVGAHHCRIWFDSDRDCVMLKDSSDTGTFLTDGRQLASTAAFPLRDGDRFYPGSREHIFEISIHPAEVPVHRRTPHGHHRPGHSQQ